MKFNNIFVSKTSATFELINDSCYYSKKDYSVYVNDLLVLENNNENVFSLYNLNSDTNYKISLEYDGIIEELHIKTEYEFVRLNVKKFGAKGDGINNDTAAIQAAIMSCPNDSTVYIPKGSYLISPIFLKSDITIEFEEGARLLGNLNREDFPLLPGLIDSTDEKEEYILNSWEGNPLETFASLITGINVENVSIIGKGILDGDAQNGEWWENHKVKRISWRPKSIFLNNCKNIVLQGIKVTNSPSWTIHPFYTENLKILNLLIVSPDDSPNTDGIDPESCSNVEIIGTRITVGDDCIVLKAGKIYMGKNHFKPCEDFNVRNCLMEKGHGSFVIGSEVSCGVKNIKVSQCVFSETDRGLRIKTRRGRGEMCVIDDIMFENIEMTGVTAPFTINMYYRCDPDGDSKYVWNTEALPVDEMTPYLGKFHFKDISCKEVHWAGVYLAGLAEQKIETVHLENITFEYAKNPSSGSPIMITHPLESTHHNVSNLGIFAFNVNEVILENVKFFTDLGNDKLITKYVNSVIEK